MTDTLPANGFHTRAEVAAYFGLSPRKISDLARANRIGIFAGKRGGYRFTDDDVQRLADAMRPVPLPKRDPRRRRGT